ncbi:MAG: hypothetical protein HYY01_06505 [Chloroflexi bacterium]|nr:hypothetical protein [Chloroflexota bacterium]
MPTALRGRVVTGLGILALLLAACGPSATATPSPTATRPAPATEAPRATATPAVAATGTPVPTAAPSPAPKATPATTGPKYGGVLRIRTTGDPESWDTGRDHGVPGEYMLWAYPRLFTFYRGAPGEQQCQVYPIKGELATGFKWVDDLTLDVPIQQGVRLPQGAPFNGRELTAEDVVFYFNRAMFVTKLNPLLNMAAITESVTATDKYTVRFKLKSAHAEYPEIALAYHATAILPRETLNPPGDPNGRYSFESHVAGAYGRFRPTRYIPAVSTEFEKNPNFFIKGLPYLDGVSLKIIPEEPTMVAAMRGGRLDSGLVRSTETMEEVRKVGGLQQEICPAASTVMAWMKLSMPEFQDVNVRRAISMALDREALNKLVYRGLASNGFSLVPGLLGKEWTMELNDYPPDVRRYLVRDVNAAKSMLSKSAYPNGFTTKLTYWSGQAGLGPMAEAITSMLDDIGIKIQLDSINRTELNIIVGQYPWDMPITKYQGMLMILSFWTAVDDLYTYSYSTSIRNRSVIKDPELDRMLQEQRSATDPAKRAQIVKDIQVRLIDQMYILGLPTSPFSETHQPYVKGIYFKTYGWYDGEPMRDVWLDK